MPVDMRELIVDATRTLLIDRHIKKLTVKDIVEQCHITRQAFYYHFEDIPDLFRWMLEKETDRILQKMRSQDSIEDELRCFFVMAANLLPFVQRGLDTNYSAELESLIRQYIKQFFTEAAGMKNLHVARSPFEFNLILSYHSHAVLGLLREWTDEDSEHIDEIVHTVYCLMTEGIPDLNKIK